MTILFTPKTLFSLLLLALSVLSANAATCQENVPATTPNIDFTVHSDGTVTHKSTGLMWMRCSLGQSWDGSTCTGSASTLTWANGLAAAKSHEFAGYSDWRLPNHKELYSIVEGRCFLPAINTDIFPNTPANLFWSSSPNNGAAFLKHYVDFINGNAEGAVGSNNLYVRLVRAGQ
ncbi:Lcl C-terminal domain-containing protein [Alishewanella sp. HL-SH05]|uniref:Lcl C-terminal domain-containing protein n=1 Tax=Alishewanella sp. HL-SH05 TaxID=3461145 RepID=UPI00404279AC